VAQLQGYHRQASDRFYEDLLRRWSVPNCADLDNERTNTASQLDKSHRDAPGVWTPHVATGTPPRAGVLDAVAEADRRGRLAGERN
jgi:hypothetical protein